MTSNKIGAFRSEKRPARVIFTYAKVTRCSFLFVFKGVFNTTSSTTCSQNSSNGKEVITLRPNKQRTKKSKNPFGGCSLL